MHKVDGEKIADFSWLFHRLKVNERTYGKQEIHMDPYTKHRMSHLALINNYAFNLLLIRSLFILFAKINLI